MSNYDVSKRNGYDPFESLFNLTLGDEYFKGNLMKTDIEEKENSYLMSVELPDVKKEDVKLSLDHGYLTVDVERKHNVNEKDNKGKYIRKERYFGSFKREYFIGEDIEFKDISAKLSDGVLRINILKPTPKTEQKNHFIAVQ